MVYLSADQLIPFDEVRSLAGGIASDKIIQNNPLNAMSNLPSQPAYWLELYRKADEARGRKEAIALINQAERLRNLSSEQKRVASHSCLF